MSGLAASALAALKYWIEWRRAKTVDEIRIARTGLERAEAILGDEFLYSGLQFSNLSFGEWTVTIEARVQFMEGGSKPTYPLIMYHLHEGTRE